jgi:dihydrodipicolinate synthase/N-acetylneuraminate lyase
MAERWSSVFAAVTTQFRDDQSLDHAATGRYIEAFVASGISGIVTLPRG